MLGLDIPLPDFWIVYLLMFWVLVGTTTTPVIFRHRGLSPLIGTLIGVGVGVLCGVVFMLLLAILNNGLILYGLSAAEQSVALGLIILFAVVIGLREQAD